MIQVKYFTFNPDAIDDFALYNNSANKFICGFLLWSPYTNGFILKIYFKNKQIFILNFKVKKVCLIY